MNETTTKSKGRGKAGDRLVTRELLEELSLEAAACGSDEMHMSISYLITAGTGLDEMKQASAALLATVDGAEKWVREIDGQTDPQPPAEISPARLRELLLALSNNLSLASSLVDAMLGALPQDGAE